MLDRQRRKNSIAAACIGSLLLLALSIPVSAAEVPGAPFGAWAIFDNTTPGHLSIPSAPELNPTDEITLEAWINTDFSFNSFEPCMTIVGKGFSSNYSLYFCEEELFSSIGNELVFTEQIDLPAGQWVHVAMTSDGTTRRHYIDGSLVTEEPENGVLSPNGANLLIGRDPDAIFGSDFDGTINEVRLWKTARTTEQIRDFRNLAIERAMPGLVAVWNFPPSDVFGNHSGNVVGDVFGLAIPPGGCSSSTSTACLLGRFEVDVTFTTGGPQQQAFLVPPASTDTGLFWFFAPNNWEVMVKVIDGCGTSLDFFWVFASASTDQGYTITVRDSLTGEEAIYTKPKGPPAPAVTDTRAIDGCNPF